jgi:hypothetical protein
LLRPAASRLLLALLLVGVIANGALTLRRDPKHFSRLILNLKARLQHELTKMVLRYLGIDS